MRAGVAKVVITPPVGCELAGYIRRLRPSTGVHDDLHARVLVVQGDESSVALVSIDLIGLGTTDVDIIRGCVEEETGIPPSHVMVACSHTHSGPSTEPFSKLGRVDPEWLQFFREAVAGSVRQAASRLEPVCIGVGSGRCRIGVNRRGEIATGSISPQADPQGVVDDQVGVIRLDRSDGRPLAAVVNYGCHPVVLGEENLLISADFPGAAMAFVESFLGGEAVALFLNGGAGNVNPVERGSFEVCDRLGVALGTAAVETMRRIHPERATGVGAEIKTTTCPLRMPDPMELAAEIEFCRERLQKGEVEPAEKAMLQARLAWAQDTRLRLESGAESWQRQIELQVLRFGDAAVVGIPAEIFAETTLEIKARYAPRFACVATYANGYFGYIAPAAAHGQGGYEVEEAFKYLNTPSSFEPEAERHVVEEIVKLLGPIR